MGAGFPVGPGILAEPAIAVALAGDIRLNITGSIVQQVYLGIVIAVAVKGEPVGGLSPARSHIRPLIFRFPHKLRTVGAHGIDLPIPRSVRSVNDGNCAVVKFQVRPAVVEGFFIVLFAVGNVHRICAVGVGQVDVPVAIPVAGEGKAAAIRRPCRIAVVRSVAGNTHRRRNRTNSRGDGKSVNFRVAVPIADEGQLVARRRNCRGFIIRLMYGESLNFPRRNGKQIYIEIAANAPFGVAVRTERQQAVARQGRMFVVSHVAGQISLA